MVGGLPDEKTDIYLCTKNLAARFITILAPSALFFFAKKVLIDIKVIKYNSLIFFFIFSFFFLTGEPLCLAHERDFLVVVWF